MKKLNILWTAFASNCLLEIHEYLLEETKSDTIANNYCNKLIGSVDYFLLNLKPVK